MKKTVNIQRSNGMVCTSGPAAISFLCSTHLVGLVVVLFCARPCQIETTASEATRVTLMRRREFLLGSAAGLLTARMSGQVSPRPRTAQPSLGAAETGIFPIPFSASMREGRFPVADDVVIVTPSDGSNDELAVAKALRDELADWFGLILTIRSDSALPTGKRAIVIGISERPLIRKAFGHAGTQPLESNSLPEAYTLRIRSDLA